MRDVIFTLIVVVSYRQCFSRLSTFKEFFTIRELFVFEGGRSVISNDNIKCKLVNASSVNFIVISQPHHGIIIVDQEIKEQSRNSKVDFTLQDVDNGKVFYYHNGNEEKTDNIIINVFLSSNNLSIDLPVKVNAVNDLPILHVLRNIKMSTQLRLTTDIITVYDADNRKEELIFTYESEYFSSSSSVWIGRKIFSNNTISNSDEFSLKHVERFTYGQLVEGEIFLVHSGPSLQNLEIRVTDGQNSSLAEIVTVEAHLVKIHKVTKTALQALRGIGTRITKNNLNFLVESDHDQLDVVYYLSEAPKLGDIQIETGNNRWSTVGNEKKYWNQKDILEGRLRYMHLDLTNDSLISFSSVPDVFKFVVSCLDVELPEETFKIEVISSQVIVERNTGIDLIVDREGIISDKHLLFSSNGAHSNESIFYKLMATPFYGDLKFSLTENKLKKNSLALKNAASNTLGFESNFTQLDLNEKKLIYRLRDMPPHAIVDNFQFAVFVPGFQSGIQKFQINYFPAYPPKLDGKFNANVANYFRLINNGLFDVFEGLSKQITIKDLCVEPLGSNDIGYVDFLFKIATPTRHGMIVRSVKEVQSFTLSDIKANLISYVHDDSENDFDFFGFTIEAMDPKGYSRFLTNVTDWMTETSGTLEIFIILRNDNEPLRVSDQQIIVIQEMNRVLTPSDIWFSDADSNFNVSDLQYEIKNMSNIYFYRCNAAGISIKRFAQKDIGNGEICLKHYGPILGENILSVTDGTFPVTTTLNVKAEPIYLRVAGSKEKRFLSKFSQITITDQKWILLESKHFAIESNLLLDGKYEDEKIFFYVLTPPTSGELRIGNEIAWQFTMSDIELKRVKFQVANKSIQLDFFRFLLKIGEHSVIGLLNVSVESDELSLQKHEKISFIDLSKSKSLRLGAEIFDFINSVDQPEEINIVVKSKPLHGRLSLGDHHRDVSHFRQNDIYDGKLTYVTALNESHMDRLPLNDSITFEATCCSGLILKDMILIIELMSQAINLTSARLSVIEGDAETLDKNFFQFNKKLFSALDIFVIEGPFNGHFVSILAKNSNEKLNKVIDISNQSDGSVTRFSTRQIENKRVSYVHDGSEMGSDYFVVVGKSFDSEKISEFVRVEVDVIPINNKLPVVISANNFNVEKGSWTFITEDYIFIGDEDTSDDKILWKLFNVSGGFIVSRKASDVNTDSNSIEICDPSKWTITRLFTQSQVISKHVAFVAQEIGEHVLTLAADDGRFTTENITINIIVTALNFSQFTFKPLLIFPGLLQKVELNDDFLKRDKFDKESVTCPLGLFHINYRVLSMPHQDQLIFKKYGSPSIIKKTNFTLMDVIKGNLYYQSGKLVNEFSISAKNELIVEISLSSSQSNDESKQVAVTDVMVSLLNINECNIHKLMIIKELIVQEGGRTLITPKHLNNEQLLKEILRYRLPVTPFYTVTEIPKHGWLYRHNKELSLESIFYQSDIDEGKMEYRHDDSESVEDHVKLKILYSFEKAELKFKYHKFDSDSYDSGFSLKIIISQKDDEPFQLIVPSPSIELVQGTHKKITTDYLSISDKDTSHEKIIYEIINQPSNCKFVLLNNSAYYSVFENHYFQNFNKNLSFKNNEFYQFGVTSFTQSDIDNEHLMILHDSKSLNHDAFYFSVTDGSHPQIFKIFHIKIEPLTIKVKKNSTELEIIQADIRAIITRRILDVETNGDRKLIKYVTTKEPEFGLIYKNNTPVDSFTQADVDDGIVSYVQTNFSGAIDDLTVGLQHVSKEFVTVKVSVTPIQNTKFISPMLKPGEKLIFTTLWLDARKLAHQTDSDPIYEVFKLPIQGALKLETDVKSIVGHRINDDCDQNVFRKNITSICFKNISRKVERSLTKLPDTPNSYFTFHHSDILSKRISYTAGPIQIMKQKDHGVSNHVKDDFEFVLSAPRTQRIIGNFQLQIDISSLISNQTIVEILSKPNEINSYGIEESEPDHADSLSTSNDLNDRLKIIGSIIFVAIIFAAAFIAYKYIKCYRKGTCQKGKDNPSNEVKSINPAITNKNEDKGPVLGESNSSTSYLTTFKERLVNQQITDTIDSNYFEPNLTNASGAFSHTDDMKNDITKQIAREDSNKFSNEITEEVDKSFSKKDNNRQSRLFDWKKIDPELLQHCRKTTPVLHTNQYWV